MTLVILTKGIDLSVAAVIALTTVASAALLNNGVSPVVVMPLMLVMGIAIWVYLGLYYPLSQSATVYRDLDGRLFRTRYGLYHQPECRSH